MPWIALEDSHVTGALSAGEAAALSSLQLQPGQTDPLPDVIEQTVSRVQGYVGVRHIVGQPGMVPDQLLQGAIAIARWNLIGRLPAKQLATEIRKQQYDDALAELKDVAAGKFALSIATEAADDQPGQSGGGEWGGTKDF